MSWATVLAALWKALTDWWGKNGNTISGMAVGAAAATTKAKLDAAKEDARQTDAAISRREANAGLSQPAAANELRKLYNARKQRRTLN